MTSDTVQATVNRTPLAEQAAAAVSGLPLAGVRVVDFSWIVAGPQATRILADFGADVIRVEYAGRIDSMRIGMVAPDAPAGSPDASGFFSNFNRNKRSITLNMADPDGLAAIKRLIAVSDVVIENYSARVMEEKGLSYAAMAAINPAIIYISISGFGHKGRDSSYVTWGPTAQAVSGLTHMSGLPGLPAAGWGFSYLDHSAGYYGALALLMALHARNATGRGQYIDLAQIETGMVQAGPQILDRSVNGRPYRRPDNPPGNRSPYPALAPHNSYPCRGEDRWIAIVCETEAQWAALVAAMESPAWATEERFATNAARVANQDALDASLSGWTRGFAPHDLMLLLQARGVPAGAVQRAQDVQDSDPQLAARGFYTAADHAVLGRHRFEGVPFAMSRSRWRVAHGAPLFGAHNEAVLGDLLGYDADETTNLTLEAAAL
jgi:benzylsuccinate CoA-transferase BbsF subunit